MAMALANCQNDQTGMFTMFEALFSMRKRPAKGAAHSERFGGRCRDDPAIGLAHRTGRCAIRFARTQQNRTQSAGSTLRLRENAQYSSRCSRFRDIKPIVVGATLRSREQCKTRGSCACAAWAGRDRFLVEEHERGDHVTLEELKEQASRIQPRNAVMEDFVGYLNFEISVIERARRAAAARREQHILQAVRRDQERAEAFQLGHQLLPSACWCGYTSWTSVCRPRKLSRWRRPELKYKYPPPGPLVEQLESTEAGCRLLLEKWALIHDCFGGKCNWIHQDVFDVIRLIGKRRWTQLMIRKLLSFSWRRMRQSRPRQKRLRRSNEEIGFARAKDFMSRVSELASTRLTPGNLDQGRATIIRIVEDAMNRLSERAEEHRRRATMTQHAERPLAGIRSARRWQEPWAARR